MAQIPEDTFGLNVGVGIAGPHYAVACLFILLGEQPSVVHDVARDDRLRVLDLAGDHDLTLG